MGVMDWFKVIMIVQLFYAVAITIMVHTVPVDMLNYVTGYGDLADRISIAGTMEEFQSSVNSQTNMPLIEVGALVFYTGNILMDLLLNFAFAVPGMISLFLQGFMSIFGLNIHVGAALQTFIAGVVGIMYLMGIIQLITGIRSGRSIT